MVRAMQHRCYGLSQRGIATELNIIQLPAICCCKQRGKVIDLLARHCLPLGHPWVSSGDCTVVQISPSKRQSGEWQANLKSALSLQLMVSSHFDTVCTVPFSNNVPALNAGKISEKKKKKKKNSCLNSQNLPALVPNLETIKYSPDILWTSQKLDTTSWFMCISKSRFYWKVLEKIKYSQNIISSFF